MNSPQHRSRKEKLICRSIVTSELVVPEDDNGPDKLIGPDLQISSDQSDLLYSSSGNSNCFTSSHNSLKVNCTSPLKSPPKLSNSNSSSKPKKVKIKGPKKPKTPPRISSNKICSLDLGAYPSGSPVVPFPTTNGTDLNHFDISNPTATHLKVQLPIPRKIKVHIPPSINICGESNGGSPTTNSNGLVNNYSPLQSNPDIKPIKIRKPRKRKGEHFDTPKPDIPRVKRKYTKRKFKMPKNESQPSPYPFHPQKYHYGPGPSPNTLDELSRIPSDFCSAFNREIEFRGSVSPSSSIPSQESSPARSEKKVFTRVDYHEHDSDELENSSTEEDCEGAEAESANARDSMSIPNNTHLLLSPVTLKRMLRTPSPSLIPPSQVPAVEDEVDEELMCNSNSLFRDLSINRQLKTPSPNGSQYGGSLSSSNGTNTSPSPTGSRLRYSRRRFGRLYPPFDPNKCSHEECAEKPLLGARYCGLHMESSGTPIYGLCQYTEPNSLKPCSQFTVGHDDREFRFCDAHASRIATTRLRMSRINRSTENYQSVKDEIKKNLEVSIDDQFANSTTTPRSPQVPASADSLDDPKEELSSEFNKEIDIPLPQHGRTFRHFAKYQPDYESDEDIMDTDEHDPLGRAGYYSTDEVISIYRSKLEKLKHLYIGQFSSLKNAYMEFKVRHMTEKEKNEGISFTYTSNPKYINVKNPSIPPEYREHQMAERQKALRLLRYRHPKGERAVIHRQAKALYQAKKTEALEKRKVGRLGEVDGDESKSACDSDSDDDVASPYQFLQTLTKREAQKREAWLSNFTSESSNATKGSLASSSSTNLKTCTYLSTESGSVRCPNQAVPCSEYCQSHVLSESSQVLFSTCNRPLSDGQDICKTPVIKSIDRFGCLIHRLAQVKKYREPEDVKLSRRKLINGLPKAELDEEKEVLENLIAKETFTMSHFDEAVRRICLSTELVDTDDSEEEESDADVVDGQARIEGLLLLPHSTTTSTEQIQILDTEIEIKEEVKEEDAETEKPGEDSNSEDPYACPT